MIDTLDYDAFGRIISQTSAALGDRFTFTGREWDPQLELYYYRARYYDPGIGRFVSQHPLGFGAGDSNLYRYVGNSPLDFTDPSGMLAITECAFVRAIHTTVNVACTVQQMSLDGSLASQDIDQQVENAFRMMNTAFDVLPFGSSLALKTTLRTITMVQTAQALASLNVNEHLFSLLEVAETYVVEAYQIYQQGAAETFHEALHAFAQSDNKQLLLTRMLCGAANMGLMVLSAQARCFVAGTPVVVNLLPPEELVTVRSADDWGITVLDVLAGVALGGAIAVRRRRRPEEDRADHQQPSDAFFEVLERDAVQSDVQPVAPRAADGDHSTAEAPTHVGQSPSSHVACRRDNTLLARGRTIRSSLAMVGCLLLALVCGLPRLLSTHRDATANTELASAEPELIVTRPPQTVTKPIEEIRCGDRIAAELPPGVAAVSEPEPEPATWRLVEVELQGDEGERVEVHLLRPLAWLEQVGSLPNGEFPLRAGELGIEGTAAVLRVQPCPTIRSGPGQVVTGTFRHTSSSLVELHLEGNAEPIICTSGHPVWSESQRDFVSASALKSGEPVRLASGTLGRVRFQQPHPGTASVFNLEVNRHHVYHVGQNGLLVHNTGVGCEDGASYRKHAVEEMIENGELSVVNTLRAGAARPPRHHLFPQKLFGTKAETKAWFSERGVDIDKITVEVTQGVHEAIHKSVVGSKGWNRELQGRLLRAEQDLPRNLTAREIWAIGYRLLREAEIRDANLLPY